jgi:hypothetical protein
VPSSTAPRVGVLLVAGTLVLLGCGQGGEKQSVRRVTEEFYAAVAAGEGSKACAELSADTITELEKQEQKRCPDAVLGLRLSGSKAAAAAVYLDSAEVELLTGDTVFLDEESDGWKVSAAGCKPAGKPSEEPYDCEVES